MGLAVTPYLMETYISFLNSAHKNKPSNLKGCFLCLPTRSMQRISLAGIKVLKRCPGLGWDRVSFPLIRWYRAVFWIQYENDVHNSLIFWMLLSRPYPDHGLLTVSCSASEQMHKKLIVAQPDLNWWPEEAKWIFHTTEHHAQDINWRQLAGSCWFLLWQGVGTGQWVVSDCTGHHLSVFGFPPLCVSLSSSSDDDDGGWQSAPKVR